MPTSPSTGTTPTVGPPAAGASAGSAPATGSTPTGSTPTGRIDARSRLVLVTLAAAQLLVILDTTIVNIAIPQAATELGLTADGRQWIITAYALTFGAVLLIGGRIADYWGRKRTFVLGVVLFAAASLLAGLATVPAMLIGGRVLQGAGAALMAPAALSLVSVTFPSGRARNTAFGVLGAITSSGAAVGLLLGGVLTEFVGWRWCLLVNVPVAAVAVVAAVLVLRESRAEGHGRLDVAGAVTIAVGLGALVYGFTLAERGWVEGGALVAIGIGVVFLVAFVLIELRVAAPLLPLRVVLDRNRGGALVVQTCAGAVMATVTLYVTFHLQQVLGFAPLVSGVATLPLALAIGAVIPVLVKTVPRTGPKPLMVVGPVVAGIGVLLLTRVSADGSYWTDVLPGLVVMGAGMAAIFVPAQNMALSRVRPEDAGAAAAAANATNQIGGAVGLAVLTNLYVAHAGAGRSAGALVAGYDAVFLGAAVVMAIAVVAAVVLLRNPQLGEDAGAQQLPAMH
ncbi:MFS transporter [Curtobacterium sp. MCBA15_004]|uniref:MFS transporter n=1 Tax=unclassified Curtobacterium TaxID=257496 RepID=UPI0009F1D9C1|nr:MFS transporter [Curtobacterium sp. MCBA15_004]WIA97523.1 MFS transporter [Curtobacterium sp. MCBA15_004]